jgi:DNA helicase-2/ATP-dependent DNA helicase PcrA
VYSFFGRSGGGGAGARAGAAEGAAYTLPPAAPTLFTRAERPAPQRRADPVDPVMAPRRTARRGSRVRHPTLGQGVVLEIDGDGDDTKLTVFFEKAGKRRLIARYANLELL